MTACFSKRRASHFAVAFDGVSMSYGRDGAIRALENVSMFVPRGKLVAVVGDSGSGKTTAVRLINLLARPTAGKVFVFGEDTGCMSKRRRTMFRGEQIGLVFQDFNLLPATVRDNVCLPLVIAGVGEDVQEARFREVMQAVPLDLDYATRRCPTELSGGEQQRVAMARAIIREPDLVTADEPTANLDPENTVNILRLLKGLTGGEEDKAKTVIWVTHNPELAFDFADRIYVFRDGHRTAAGKRGPRGFKDEFKQQVRESFQPGKERRHESS